MSREDDIRLRADIAEGSGWPSNAEAAERAVAPDIVPDPRDHGPGRCVPAPDRADVNLTEEVIEAEALRRFRPESWSELQRSQFIDAAKWARSEVARLRAPEVPADAYRKAWRWFKKSCPQPTPSRAFIAAWRAMEELTGARAAAAPRGQATRPKVVTLSGSRKRAGRAFIEQDTRLTLEGCIVLSIDDPANSSCAERPEGVKAQLDELHFRKIDLSDEVLVLNVGGYIGNSTRNEIAYAERVGVPVRYLEDRSATAGALREQGER